MFKALHPEQDESIRVSDFIHLRLTEPWIGDARCPACEQGLGVKGDGVPNSGIKAHFYHRRDESAPRCPIKSEGAIRYVVLTERLPDTDLAAKLRKDFFNNWTYHWHQFKSYVKGVDIKDFAKALSELDERKVWRYRDIKEHEVIIVMLATRDFKPVKDKEGNFLRSRWVRFWFKSEVKELDEFWNLGDGQKVLIRAEYELSDRATKIQESAFRDFDVVRVKSDYMKREDYSTVPYFVQLVMSERFPGLVAVPKKPEPKPKPEE